MKKNKIIAFLVLVFVFSLLNTKQIFAAEAAQDVIPFSNEVKNNIVKAEPILSITEVKTVDSVIPVVTSPKSNENLDGAQIIRGEVKSGYDVKVYIDGKYRTILSVWPSKTGVSGFYYQPIQKLTLGKHDVRFVSSKDGKDYGSSKIVDFEVVEGYTTPDILTPYYYADDFSTYVIRGYGNTGSKIEVYVDGVKVRFIDSLYGTKATSYFALAVRNLKEGDHKAYVLSYAKDSNISSKSKIIYFKVSKDTSKGNVDIKEIKKEEVKKEEIKKDTTKIDEKKKAVTKPTEVKKEVKKDIKAKSTASNQKEKQDKSILIGIILLVLAVILIIFWLASENKEKIKKFIDNLFEEDDDDDKKNNENK